MGAVRVNPPTVLAPMAGVTLRPFRRLCRQMGAGLVCGEMISAMALHYGNRKTHRMLGVSEDERPVSLQIAAGDPDVAAEAVRRAVSAGADIVDLNFGCPVPKVRKSGAGAILLTDPPRARAIVKAAVAAAGATPVTVKLRAGWDEDRLTFHQVAAEAVEAGCAALTLHARTAVQMYSGQAHWPWIAELVAESPFPVIGNGAVRGPEDCLRMFEETGCAGVMIGRASQGDPWIFERCAAALRGEDPRALPTWGERLQVAGRLCADLVEELGERIGCLHARRVLAWFARGMPEASAFRDRAHKVCSLQDVAELLAESQGEWSDHAEGG